MPGTVALLCDDDRHDELRRLLAGPAVDRHERRSRRRSQQPLRQPRLLAGDARSRSRFTVGLLFMVCFVGGLYRARRSRGMSSIGGRPRPGRAGAQVRATRSSRSRSPTSSRTTSRCWPTRARRWPRWSPTRSATARTSSGPRRATIDYNVISATGIWYVQVAALVLGHVAGPHARPRPRARRLPSRRATRRARSTGCWPSWSASPASASGSSPHRRNNP